MKLRIILPKEIKKGMFNIAMDVQAKGLLPFMKGKGRRKKKIRSVSHEQCRIHR